MDMTQNAPTLATRQTLSRGTTTLGRAVALFHCPAGLYLAGSGTRVQKTDTWLVSVAVDNTPRGQHFQTEAAARDWFERLVGTEVV